MGAFDKTRPPVSISRGDRIRKSNGTLFTNCIITVDTHQKMHLIIS